MKSKKNLILDYIEKSIQTKRELLKTRVEVIAQIAKEIIDATNEETKCFGLVMVEVQQMHSILLVS